MFSISRLLDKTGVIGALVASMGCAACFPALGALASALGLGFLAQFEGVIINTLLPVFALVALGGSVFSFLIYKRWGRLVAGVAGPTMVLLTLYPLWSYGWSTYLFYMGLLVMMFAAIWDIALPSRRACSSTQVRGVRHD